MNFWKTRLILLVSKSLNFLLLLLQRTLFRRFDNPSRILVFRTGSIGDSICAMPAIANIRANFPVSTIHLLTNSGKGYVSLVSMEKLIAPDVFDAIINYENLNRHELIHLLKKEQYDLLIQLPQYDATLRNLVRDLLFFRFFAGIKSGFGWCYSGATLFKKTQEQCGSNLNERDRLNAILKRHGLKINASDMFHFNITDEDAQVVQQEWNGTNLDLSKITIGIIIGAKRPQNRWPIGHFEAVVQHFSNTYNIIFIGGPEDVGPVSSLLDFPHTHSFCGRLTPVQSGLMMCRCTAILSNDTGPMHLAYSFGNRVLALFSCRDFPGRWYPPQNGDNIILRSENIPCSLCFSETCSDNICMKKIRPEEVIHHLETMLSYNDTLSESTAIA